MSGEGQSAPATGTPTTWYGGYDADTQSHLTGRGWDKLTVDQAAAQAIKAHREAEKMIGVPAENLLRAPKDANDKENLAKIHARLGVPTDPKEYTFDGLKRASGEDVAPEFVEKVRGLAAKYNLPKDSARALAADLVAEEDSRDKTATTAYEQKLIAEREKLDKDWGANKATNLIVAQNAAAKLGLTPEEVSALEKTTSYSRVMEMFRQIGTRIGEDKFVNRDTPGTGALTAEEAQSKLDALGKDGEWMKKFDNGDVEANAMFNNLTKIIAASKSRR